MNKKNIEAKRTNFKMYKKGRSWVFASAVFMSLLGFAAFGSNMVSADTVDAPTAAMVVGESTTDTGSLTEASLSDEAGVVQSSAAAIDQAASKNVVDSTSADAATTAAVTDSNASSASDSATVESASSTPVSVAQAADTTDETVDATGEMASQPDSAIGDTATEQADAVTTETAANSTATDVSADAAVTTPAVREARKRFVGVEVLSQGEATLSNNASTDGVTVDENGNYLGTLTLTYNSTDWLATLSNSSAYVIDLPAEFRPLFAHDGAKQYVDGTYHSSAWVGGTSRAYTSDDISISEDGSTIILTNPGAIEIGQGEVTIVVNLHLASAIRDTGVHIPAAEDGVGYHFQTALVEDNDLISGTVDLFGVDNTADVTLNMHKIDHTDINTATPIVNAIYDGDMVISGTGIPGNRIKIYENGLVIGQAVVGNDGSWRATVPAQVVGNQVEVSQSDSNGLFESNRVPGTVLPTPAVKAPRVTNTLYPDTAQVLGTADPNVTVYITNDNGITIGSGRTNGAGNFDIAIQPQDAGSKLQLVAENDRGVVSDPAIVTVQNIPHSDVESPMVDNVYTDSTTITGSSTESTVRIIDAAGDLIGSATVVNGRFTIPVWTTLTVGETLYAIASDADGNDSDRSPVTVKEAVAVVAPPTIDNVYTDSATITGTSTESTVRITDESGALIGTATVENGEYTIPVRTQLNAGDKLTATAYDGAGNPSAGVDTTVKPAVVVVAEPTINTVYTDSTTITGTSTEDTVKVTDAAGDLIGTATVENGEYTIPVRTQLNAGDKLTATAYDGAGNPSAGVDTTVQPAVVVVAEPTINTVYTDSATITGTSTEDTVKVTDEAGDLIGTATVENGEYTIPVRTQLNAGDKLTATAYDGAGNPSAGVDTTVQPAKVEVAAPTIDTVYTDSATITGTSTETSVRVTDAAGDLIGTATVENGQYAIQVRTQLSAGEKLTATAYDGAGNRSAGVDTTVQPATVVVAEPTINTVYTDSLTITGTSTEDTVKVTDEAGDLIGTATVENGEYTIPVRTQLNAGDKLTATAYDGDGNPSAGVDTTVQPATVVVAEPTINTVYTDSPTITGTSTEDTVKVTEEAGDLIGTATVENGEYTIPVRTQLNAGDKLTATAYDGDGNPSAGVETTVQLAVVVDAPTIDALTSEATEITGTSTATTVTVTDEGGNTIGSAPVAGGRYTIPVTTPLTAGTKIIATAYDNDGHASPTTEATVGTPATQIPAPTLSTNPVTDETATLTGTGSAVGHTIRVTDQGGNVIGEAETTDDGTGAAVYTINLTRTLVPGEVITVVETDGDVTSPGTEKGVVPATAVLPTPMLEGGLHDGMQQVTVTPGQNEDGSYNVGNTIVVINDSGTELGSFKIVDGNPVTIKLSEPLTINQIISAIETDGVNNSRPSNQPVGA